MTQQQFIEEVAKYVQKYAPQYGIKVVSSIVAQAVLESASGTSELAVNAHNYFGLKYRKNRCPSACGIYYKVGSEQNADGSYSSSAMQWMKFASMEDGIRGYFEFINTTNYASVKGVADPKVYLENIKKAGYATSINYVKNLLNVIEKYNLTKYDTLTKENNTNNKEGNKMSYKIAIDAGHGYKTAGKQTPDGIKEWTLNDKVRDKIVDILSDYDIEFIFPDNDEGNVDEGLTSRKTMYVSKDVDAFVSIHHNANTGIWNNATGVEVYTDKNPIAQDVALANAIYKNLPKYTGLKGRGIKQANFAVINQNSVPAVLVEGGFMDGKKDYKIITSDAGQTGYAKAVAEGLISFLGLKKRTNSPTLPSSTRSYLMKGDKGDQVKALQENLNYLGYSCGTADGDFGTKTDTALRAFQKAYKLTVDGKYGSTSKEVLEDAVANKKTSETASKKYYRIQVGAYNLKVNAEKLQNDLKRAGFDGIIKRIGVFYKVQVGAYSSKANAEAMLAKVAAKGFKAFITYN